MREEKLHINVGGPRGWTTACGISSANFVDKMDELEDVDCERCLNSKIGRYFLSKMSISTLR